MEIKKYLAEQMKLHPAMQPQDVMKLLYQAAFGAEHILKDVEAARVYLQKEYDMVESHGINGEMIFECISDEFCRINLRVWKECGRSAEELFEIFAASVKEMHRSKEEGKALFGEYYKAAEEMVREDALGIQVDEWLGFVKEYPLEEPVAVHHSEHYRLKERPAYRVVSCRYVEKLLD